MLPLKDRATQTVEQMKVKIEGLNRTISDTNASVDKLQQSMRQANDSMGTLRAKKASAEQAATATDAGVSKSFTLPLFTADNVPARHPNVRHLEPSRCH